MTPGPDDLVLVSKGDLFPDVPDAVSGKTGAGVSALVTSVTDTLSNRTANQGLATRLRHQQAMERGLDALTAARALLPHGEDSADIAAEELRTAIRALDSLVGRVDIENVLDEIFASFCLGK